MATHPNQLNSQEPTFFSTTIRVNVAHGLIGTVHEHANEEEKFALIKTACVKAWVMAPFLSKAPTMNCSATKHPMSLSSLPRNSMTSAKSKSETQIAIL